MTTERRATGIALLALGVGLLGGGAAFALAARKNANDANARCPQTTCADPGALDLNARAIDDASLADLTLVAGGVAIAAGVVVLATRLGASRPVAARIWVHPTLGGLVVGGAF